MLGLYRNLTDADSIGPVSAQVQHSMEFCLEYFVSASLCFIRHNLTINARIFHDTQRKLMSKATAWIFLSIKYE